MSHPVVNQQITFFYTKDLAGTADFYENVMGFDLVLDQGACRIYGLTGSSFVGFCEKAKVPTDKSNVIFTLVTDQVDEWYQYLQSKGVDFEKPPAENPQYKIYHCFLRDPNGYMIEIQKFLDPRWGES